MYHLTHTVSQIDLNGDNAITIEIMLIPFEVTQYGYSSDHTKAIKLDSITLPYMTLGDANPGRIGATIIGHYMKKVETRVTCGFYDNLVETLVIYKNDKRLEKFSCN